MRSQPICGCLWHHLCYCCCYKKTEEAKFEKSRFILELGFRNVFMFIWLHCVVTVMRKRTGWGGVKSFTSLVPKSKNERKGLGGKQPLQGNTPGNPSPSTGSTSNISSQQGRAPRKLKFCGFIDSCNNEVGVFIIQSLPRALCLNIVGTMTSTQELLGAAQLQMITLPIIMHNCDFCK